ncbi:MAG: polyprenyl synthetase family protein [Pseudomonadota bacterium]
MQDPQQRTTVALETALALGRGNDCPPGLAAAVEAAVFPGGSRLRPKLCLAVAAACGDPCPQASAAAAAAIELLHCASLVHDDMPCFDDAAIRRGLPSVHAAYGEPLALLAGDALIVLAFESLAVSLAARPGQLAPLVRLLARSVGMADGLCAGQAWECEPEVEIGDYHRAKTGALFAASTEAGALAAGAPAAQWRALGAKLGEAYQVADDLRDVAATCAELGKPTQQDRLHQRPNAVAEVGARGCLRRVKLLVEEAVASIPACPGAPALKQLIADQAAVFVPPELVRRVA